MQTFRVAVTGGICSGKTFVLSIFKKYKIPAFSFDEAAHWCLQNNGDVLLKIEEAFPFVVSDGGVDRLALRKVVFDNKLLLAKLESILHPYLFQMELDFFNSNLGQAMVVSEVPLLFEKNLVSHYDCVILTTCAQDVKITRAAKRSIDKDALLKAQSLQMGDKEKICRSDLILDTTSAKLENENEIAIKALIDRFVV